MVPGVFATVENFFCSSYFPHFREYLLNRDHIMLPFADLRHRRQELFEMFGRNGKIFVCPDSPLKLFTGLVVSEETFEKDLEFMAFYEFPPDSVVVVSSPKGIVKEWRFVVANGQIVAAHFTERVTSHYRSRATKTVRVNLLKPSWQSAIPRIRFGCSTSVMRTTAAIPCSKSEGLAFPTCTLVTKTPWSGLPLMRLRRFTTFVAQHKKLQALADPGSGAIGPYATPHCR